jgi:hypothetical protein
MIFIGLDLSSSPYKPSACVGLDELLSLTLFTWFGSDAEIIATINHYSPELVAIDAPQI